MSDIKSGQVKRSLLRFRDYANDLIIADFNTFDDRFNQFIEFCSMDSVFTSIHSQLTSNPNVNFVEWFNECNSSGGSMVGSGKLMFPTNIDDKISIMYQLLLRIHSNEIPATGFFITFFAVGSNNMGDYIRAFSDAVIQPLIRELEYKLEEIEESLPENNKEVISTSLIQVINAGDNFIQQISQGDGNSQTATQSNVSPELLKHLEDLKLEIHSAITDVNDLKNADALVDGVYRELKQEKPNKTVIQALLNSLPKVANIAAIIGTIVALL